MTLAFISSATFPHGTRARYNSEKCRCADCRKANRDYEVARQAKRKARAAEIVGQTQPAPKTWTTPSGEVRPRTYKRARIGLNGQPCPFGSHLRKDSTGDICARCRCRLNWNGLVSAEPVREHLLALSKQNVGYKSVAAASDVPETTLFKILHGTRRFIRAEALRKVLDVDVSAIADHALVPARPTVALLRELIKLGFRRYDIARKLGSTARVPSLQIKNKRGRGGGFVLAKTALRVQRLHAELFAGEDEQVELDAMKHLDYDKPWFRILRALRFFDGIAPQDLFNAMEVPPHDLEAYRQALQRLYKRGEVVRFGVDGVTWYSLPSKGGASS